MTMGVNAPDHDLGPLPRTVHISAGSAIESSIRRASTATYSDSTVFNVLVCDAPVHDTEPGAHPWLHQWRQRAECLFGD